MSVIFQSFYKTVEKCLKKIEYCLSKWIYKLRLSHLGEKCFISSDACFVGFTDNISLGDHVFLGNRVKLSCDKSSSRIEIGSNTQIHDSSMLLTYGGSIIVGSECSINPMCILYGHGGLIIGNQVRIAAQTVIIPANHNFSDIDQPICKQGHQAKGITIEDNVWIGSSVKILDGCRIGSGSVIGAGSVVTKSVPPFSIAVGVPAKVIKKRN